jgi:hypothetical protein
MCEVGEERKTWNLELSLGADLPESNEDVT